jgi:sporulation protein YlmC with PRC-barrel domain
VEVLKMKASNFIGMTVLDSEANEVGKIAEIEIRLKHCLVDKMWVSTGSALNKKYFAIVEDDLARVGDYVQLKLNPEEISLKPKVNKLGELTGAGYLFKDITGKTVLTYDAMEVGKINDMLIDPTGCLIHNIIISTGPAFRKKQLKISDVDIHDFGDYVILKLRKEDVDEKITD